MLRLLLLPSLLLLLRWMKVLFIRVNYMQNDVKYFAVFSNIN